MALEDLAVERYVSITTYRRDGGSSATPVWIVPLGNGSVGFTTGASSLKVKRIGRDPRVTLQASDARGRVKPASAPVEGVAAVVTGDGHERVRAAVAAKYGWQYRAMTIAGAAGRLIGRGAAADCAVIVSPARPE